MRALFRLFRGWQTPSPTLIEVRISSKALVGNYQAFKDVYGLPVAPVLKSNAYGHGLLQAASILAPKQPPFFVVDSYFEAKILRRHGIATPILVVGFVPPDIIKKNRLTNISFVVTSLEGLQMLIEHTVQEKVHIKLDTGMRRQGLLPAQVPAALELLKRSSIQVEGICSHFASADSSPEFTRLQITEWNGSVSVWKEAFPSLTYWHIAASAGSAYAKECDANLIRLGSGLYGVERIPERAMPLLPVLSVHSMLTVVKEIQPGDQVGYNGIFTAERVTLIATVPVGYFEGFDRRLSNRGVMLVEGHICPVIGRVSMNMSTIDVSACHEAKLGTPVVVISDDPKALNSVLALSELCDMSPLEFMVHIPSHLRRVIV